MSERSAAGRDNLDLFKEREAPAPAPRVWTVGQVNEAARLMLEQGLGQLWVAGEVANFRRTRGGHCYFTLKDGSAQVDCVMFHREARTLPTDPQDGMTLRLFGRLTVYAARGRYQFVAARLEAEEAEGMWKLAFDRLRRKLDAEGLTDPARRRPLPEFPRTVGIVTSPGSAALRDVISVTRRRAPWLRLLVRGAGVQGRGSGAGIASAITTLAGRGVDLVIVARGGGSIEDLWGFNEESVARAVADCPVPVISGVGHETDTTICDLVADLRAATPSAAAEAAAPDRRALERRLDGLAGRLARALSAHARTRRWKLDTAASQLAASVRQRLSRESGRLSAAAAAMEALSPLSTLARGYAVPLDADGRLLRSAGDFGNARRFRLRVVDGSVPCQVTGEPVQLPGVAGNGR